MTYFNKKELDLGISTIPYILSKKHKNTKVWVLITVDDFGDIAYHWQECIIKELANPIKLTILNKEIEIIPWINVDIKYNNIIKTLKIYMYPEERLYNNNNLFQDIIPFFEEDDCNLKDIECIIFDKNILTQLDSLTYSYKLTNTQIIQNHIYLQK